MTPPFFFLLKGCIHEVSIRALQHFGQVCCVHVKRHCKRLKRLRCAGLGWDLDEHLTVLDCHRNLFGYGMRVVVVVVVGGFLNTVEISGIRGSSVKSPDRFNCGHTGSPNGLSQSEGTPFRTKWCQIGQRSVRM